MFFCGDTEGEDALVIGVSEAEIAKAYDVHANNDIIVFEIAFHHFAVGYHIASGYQDMNQIGVRVACPTNARDASLLVRLKMKLFGNARGNNSGRGTCVPHGIVGVKHLAGQRINIAFGLQGLHHCRVSLIERSHLLEE